MHSCDFPSLILYNYSKVVTIINVVLRVCSYIKRKMAVCFSVAIAIFHIDSLD